MPNVTMKELLEAGVHFGHQTTHWHPKMKPYVFGQRNGIYIIDLQKTVEKTRTACDFVKNIVADGKKVLFVGTKKQAKEVVENEAKRAQMPYVTNRWLGGMLTNYQTVKASIDRMKKLEDFKNSDNWKDISKKEQSRNDKYFAKLDKSLGGIRDMKRLPGVVFIVDVIKEHIAIKEAKKLGIPTVAVVDTNSDPSEINFVMPGNDDAIRSVSLFAHLISESCIEGERLYQEKLKARAGANQDDDGKTEEKKVSRFEGDVDLQGLDEADLEALDAPADAEGAEAEAAKEEKKS